MRICLKYLKLRYATRSKERNSENSTENMNASGRSSPPRNWLQDYGILFDPAMPPPPLPPPSTLLQQSSPAAPIASCSNQVPIPSSSNQLPIPSYSNQLPIPSMSNQPPLPTCPPPPPPPPTTSPNGTILLKQENMNADSPKVAEGVPEPDMMPAYSSEIKPPVAPGTKSNFMCRDFVRGICLNEAVCQFRHEIIPEQLPGIFTFCKDFENNTCKYDNCKYVHATIFEKAMFYRTGHLSPHTTAHRQHSENYFKPPGQSTLRAVPSPRPPSVAGRRRSWQPGMSQSPNPRVPQARSVTPKTPCPSPRGYKRNWGTSEYPAAGSSLPKASPSEPRRKCICGGTELSGGSRSMGYPNPMTTTGPNSNGNRNPDHNPKEIKHCVNGIVGAAAAIVASSFSQVMDQIGNQHQHPYHGYPYNWDAYYGPHQQGSHDNGHPYYRYTYGPYNYGPYNHGPNYRQAQSQQTFYGHPNNGRSNSRQSPMGQQPRRSPRLGQVPPQQPSMVQPNSGVPNNGDPPMVQPYHRQPNNVQLNHEHAYPGYPYNHQ